MPKLLKILRCNRKNFYYNFAHPLFLDSAFSRPFFKLSSTAFILFNKRNYGSRTQKEGVKDF